MNTRRDRNRWLGPRLLALACVALLAGTVSAQASGTCLTVDVEDRIVLPDGSRYAGGELRICLTRNYSPVAGLHEVAVDGMKVGLLRSRLGVSESTELELPYVLFERMPEGDLRLIGFALPGARSMSTYRLAGTTSAAQPTARNENEEASGSTVLLVARAD